MPIESAACILWLVVYLIFSSSDYRWRGPLDILQNKFLIYDESCYDYINFRGHLFLGGGVWVGVEVRVVWKSQFRTLDSETLEILKFERFYTCDFSLLNITCEEVLIGYLMTPSPSQYLKKTPQQLYFGLIESLCWSWNSDRPNNADTFCRFYGASFQDDVAIFLLFFIQKSRRPGITMNETNLTWRKPCQAIIL